MVGDWPELVTTLPVSHVFGPGPTSDTHAFLWEAGQMTDLGTIGDVGFASYATDPARPSTDLGPAGVSAR